MNIIEKIDEKFRAKFASDYCEVVLTNGEWQQIKAELAKVREQVAELVEALEDVGAWINTLPAGTKSATAKGLMIDALLAKAKEMM